MFPVHLVSRLDDGAIGIFDAPRTTDAQQGNPFTEITKTSRGTVSVCAVPNSNRLLKALPCMRD